METVLDRARNSQWTINPVGIDVILASADYLRRWLAHMEAVLHQESSQAPARDEALLDRIARLSSEPGEPAPPGLAALAAAVSPRQAELEELSLAPSAPAATVSSRRAEADELHVAPSAPSTSVSTGAVHKSDEPVSGPAAAAAPAAATIRSRIIIKTFYRIVPASRCSP